jgi:phosphate transport system ATP-binding protein
VSEAIPDSSARSEARIELRAVSCAYGSRVALRSVDLSVAGRSVSAIVGPSGCGKSTLLRVLNRMNDGVDGAKVTGSVLLDGADIYRAGVDVVALRRRVGLVFQRPAVFAMPVFDNVAYGPRAAGQRDKRTITRLVESALRRAALWDEVKDRLDGDASALSLGQQQRLCIARALAVEPEVLLLDEPTSALDPGATARVEDLLAELRKTLAIVVVTHSMAQAARVSQMVAFLDGGALVECGETRAMFTRPTDKRTQDFLSGRYRS